MKYWTSILLTLMLNQAYAGEFSFNNKNLNTLGALVCDLSSTNAQTNTIIAHKMDLEIKRTGPNKNDVSYIIEVSCNIQIDKKTKKTISYGDPLSISFSELNSEIKGQLGINELILNFKNKTLRKITIKDPLMLSQKSFEVNKSEWAHSDQIFNFNKAPGIKLNLNRNIAAVESDSTLSFNHGNKSKFFNLWSYQSYGCSNKNHTIDSELCYQLLE